MLLRAQSNRPSAGNDAAAALIGAGKQRRWQTEMSACGRQLSDWLGLIQPCRY